MSLGSESSSEDESHSPWSPARQHYELHRELRRIVQGTQNVLPQTDNYTHFNPEQVILLVIRATLNSRNWPLARLALSGMYWIDDLYWTDHEMDAALTWANVVGSPMFPRPKPQYPDDINARIRHAFRPAINPQMGWA